jgi:hypothetical protein
MLLPTFNFKPVAVFSIILALLTGTSFGTVSASKNTLPGDTLYSVKITTESIMYTFAFTKEKKVELAVQSAKNRVDEIKRIVAGDNSAVRIATASNHLKNNLNQVQESVMVVENASAVKKVDDSLAEIQNEIKLAVTNSNDSENFENKDIEEIKNIIEKTNIITLSVLVNTDETQEFAIDEQELKDRIIEKLATLKEVETIQDLTAIEMALETGDLKTAINGIVALTTETVETETETDKEIVTGEVKGEETTASTTVAVSENNLENNTSSASAVISVPAEVIDILGIHEEEEIVEEFNVGLK